MKEYCLYIRNGSGIPYYLKPYSNYSDARKALDEIIQFEEERQRPYFVDNDFFENKYSNISNLKYVCLKVRDVTEWLEYSQKKTMEENYKKVIYINNFKK